MYRGLCIVAAVIWILIFVSSVFVPLAWAQDLAVYDADGMLVVDDITNGAADLSESSESVVGEIVAEELLPEILERLEQLGTIGSAVAAIQDFLAGGAISDDAVAYHGIEHNQSSVVVAGPGDVSFDVTAIPSAVAYETVMPCPPNEVVSGTMVAAFVGVIGQYAPPVVTRSQYLADGHVVVSTELVPGVGGLDWQWIFSAICFLLFQYCFLRLLGGIWARHG